MQDRSLGWEDPLEKEVATHTSTLAWRTPWTEEPGELESTESQSQTRLHDLAQHTHSRAGEPLNYPMGKKK